MEDYLEAVLTLTGRDGQARVSDIAQLTGVSKCSVTAALKHLARAGLVDYDPYRAVRLTAIGRTAAGKVRHKHDALARFMTQVLSLDAGVAEANACRIEHVVDNCVLRRLAMLAEFVLHGQPPGQSWRESFSEFRARQES